MSPNRKYTTLRLIMIFRICFCSYGQPLIQIERTESKTLDKNPGTAHLYEEIRKQSIQLLDAEHKVSFISSEIMGIYKKDVTDLMRKFTELSRDAEIVSQNLTEYGNSVDETDNSLEEFYETFNMLSKNVSELLLHSKSQEKRENLLDEEIRGLVNQTIIAKNESQKLQSSFDSMKRNPVGFTVYLGQDANYTDKSRLNFAEVISNIGGQFNREDGVFNCLTSGMYLFSATICSQIGSRAHASIVQNTNTVLSRLIAEDKNTHDCGSMDVVSEILSGDLVWIRSENFSMFDTQTYFSGVLIMKTV
ncbi:uncharacterized protein LOC133183770 [Saccostrea echinata]|uniref:uncharacterized protein LOC133183770 n=1 Tax=Saccostrea echinata TaxID=191078 RepID=UPI002A81500C|nr:uncharacterized protein LOC133183770 [Saccostrea echinata]